MNSQNVLSAVEPGKTKGISHRTELKEEQKLFLLLACIRLNSNNMFTDINPKLPLPDKAITRDFYLNKLDFREFGSADFDG